MRPGELELRWSEGGEERRARFADGTATLGRGPESEVRLADKSASRRHATIAREGGRWLVRDCGSANGTWLDGRVCREAVLTDGARLRIGGVELACVLGAAPGLAERAEPAPRDDAGTMRASAVVGRLGVDDFQSLVEYVLSGEGASGDRPAGETGSLATDRWGRGREGAGLSAAKVVALVRTATDALLELRDLDATLRVVLDLVFDHLPVDRGAVLLVGDDGELVPAVRRGRDPDDAGEIRVSQNIARTAVESREALLVEDAAEDERFRDAVSVAVLDIHSAMCVPLCREGRVVGLLYVDRTSVEGAFRRSHLELLSLLASLSAAAVERARMRESFERERALRERLSRYSAPNVVEHLVRTADAGDGDVWAGEERDVTVLFGDLVGFTSLAETLPPRAVTRVLNDVFQALTEEVFREAGTLDKFIGDAVMAFWGAPLEQPDHAPRAVRAALAMQRRLAACAAAAGVALGMRIGINSGPAIVGDVGARERRDFTVIGDTVNVASRLESHVAGPGEVVVGPDTRLRLGDAFRCAPLAELRLRGRSAACVPHRVEGPA